MSEQSSPLHVLVYGPDGRCVGAKRTDAYHAMIKKQQLEQFPALLAATPTQDASLDSLLGKSLWIYVDCRLIDVYVRRKVDSLRGGVTFDLLNARDLVDFMFAPEKKTTQKALTPQLLFLTAGYFENPHKYLSRETLNTIVERARRQLRTWFFTPLPAAEMHVVWGSKLSTEIASYLDTYHDLLGGTRPRVVAKWGAQEL
jgi:hypothetical protein